MMAMVTTLSRTLLFLVILLLLFSSSNAWTTPPPPFGISVCDVRNAATTLAVTLTLASVLSDISNSKPNIAKGARIFDTTCASCHVNGGNKIDSKKTLSKEDLETYLGLDPSDVQLYMKSDFLHRGANLFGGDLSERDLQNVVAFVLNQANEDKWLVEW